MFVNCSPISKTSMVESSGGCFSVGCWIQPHDRSNRKTLHLKTVAFTSIYEFIHQFIRLADLYNCFLVFFFF